MERLIVTLVPRAHGIAFLQLPRQSCVDTAPCNCLKIFTSRQDLQRAIESTESWGTKELVTCDCLQSQHSTFFSFPSPRSFLGVEYFPFGQGGFYKEGFFLPQSLITFGFSFIFPPMGSSWWNWPCCFLVRGDCGQACTEMRLLTDEGILERSDWRLAHTWGVHGWPQVPARQADVVKKYSILIDSFWGWGTSSWEITRSGPAEATTGGTQTSINL